MHWVNPSDSLGRRRGAGPSSCRTTHSWAVTPAQDTGLSVHGSCATAKRDRAGCSKPYPPPPPPAGLGDDSACKTHRQHFCLPLAEQELIRPVPQLQGRSFQPAVCCVDTGTERCWRPAQPTVEGLGPTLTPSRVLGGLWAVHGLSHGHPRRRGWPQPLPWSLPTEQHRSGKQPQTEARRPLCHRCPSPEPPGDEEMQSAVNVRHFMCHHL